jgi:hypothetical protein
MSEPPSLIEVTELALRLPPDQQRQLAESLLRHVAPRPGRRWRDVRGAAKHPLCGRDAQDWVSESRRDSDARRQPSGAGPA